MATFISLKYTVFYKLFQNLNHIRSHKWLNMFEHFTSIFEIEDKLYELFFKNSKKNVWPFISVYWLKRFFVLPRPRHENFQLRLFEHVRQAPYGLQIPFSEWPIDSCELKYIVKTMIHHIIKFLVMYKKYNFQHSKLCAADSMAPLFWRSHLTSIGNPTMEIRRSYDCLISTMGISILER